MSDETTECGTSAVRVNRGKHDDVSTTTCCVVGGGPAGMMLSLLLARAGVRVTVLEKHADFLRDFRGDTIHPSTLELMGELGLREQLERRPHQVVTRLRADVNGQWIEVADLSTLKARHRCIYMMPQWDFLDLLATCALTLPSFRLEMSAEVTGLWIDHGRVAGVVYRSGGETRRLRADLTVACDGRGSTVRAVRGVRPIELGAPMDVLWFRLPRKRGDPDETFGVIRPGRMLVMIDRASYWQVGYLIPKGDDERVRDQGIEGLRATLATMAPFVRDGRLDALASWDRDVRTLRVQVSHLERWFYPGLLFIGDAAHAMSPIGGVGINLALQDAVAVANLLAEPLRRGRVTQLDLARVQARRAWPAALTQLIQLVIQRRVIRRVLAGRVLQAPSSMLRVLELRPIRALVARGIGIGFCPEHWRGHVSGRRGGGASKELVDHLPVDARKGATTMSGPEIREGGKDEKERAPQLGRRQRIEHVMDRMEHAAARIGHSLERPLIGASVAGGLVAAAAGLWGPTEALLGAAAGLFAFRLLKRRRTAIRTREESPPPAMHVEPATSGT